MDHSPFYNDLVNKRQYAQKILTKAKAPNAKENDRMIPEEVERSTNIIAMYDKLLTLVQDVEKGDTTKIIPAANTLLNIRRVEGKEIPPVAKNNESTLKAYSNSKKRRESSVRLENQKQSRCGIHALNHILQEEKLVCIEENDSIFIDVATKGAAEANPMSATVLLNAPKICEAYGAYADCTEGNMCNNLPIIILQHIFTPTSIDPDLPNISLKYQTKGIEFVNDKRNDKAYYSVEVPILSEIMKTLLSEPTSIGALLNFNNWHYTAIVNKGGFAGAPAGTDFTYIDSLDNPCEFKTLKDSNYLMRLANRNKIPKYFTGHYTYNELPWLMEALLKGKNQRGNIDVTIVQYAPDGSSYFCQALENILTSRVASGGMRRKRTQRKRPNFSRKQKKGVWRQY